MTKKYFIIAGEASGDLLGSKLISEIKALENDAIFVGVGGSLMQHAGLKTIFPMNDLAVMGFFEILPHLFKLIGRINETARAILQEKPDYIQLGKDMTQAIMEWIRKYLDEKLPKKPGDIGENKELFIKEFNIIANNLSKLK